MQTDSDPTAFSPQASWPQAMERGRVTDAAFATAYARVSDLDRARIKTGIAAIYAACGGPMPRSRRRVEAVGHDLLLTREDVPLDFAVIVCGAAFASPARLAAAVIPALCARVAEVAAVRVGGAWPRPLLTTLELCGVETVCRVGKRAVSGLWRELAERGDGAVVLLDDAPAPTAGVGGALRVLSARLSGGGCLVAEDAAAFDREALAFAQPDMELSEIAGDQLAKAAASAYAVAYAAGGRDGLSGLAPLWLGPGRETFWLWPELVPGAFRRQRVTALRDDDASSADEPGDAA